MSGLDVGSELAVLRVTPDRYLTIRYAGASGDFNPIHLDDELAEALGLPGRIIHGLYTMGLVARAQTEAAGGPAKLKRLAVQFRGPAVPGHEIEVTATVTGHRDGRAIISTSATQQGKAIVRGASAEVEL